MALKRMCSAARPWCVGMTWANPVMSLTAASNRKNDAEPAYDSSLAIIPAHCADDIAPVPLSVRRSTITSSARRRNGL